MSSTATLIDRNRQFAQTFDLADLPILPRLRTVLLTCGDARVDPAHLFELELGDAVVIRNNGGRVTSEVENEIAALAFLVAQMDGGTPGPFELLIVQHTQCGAERFADPALQHALKQRIGVDVSPSAISDHESSLREDIARLKNSSKIPGYIVASGYIYDVRDGSVRQVIPPAPLSD